VWAFSADNILFTNGGSIVRFDGTNAVMDCGMNSLLTGAIIKIYAFTPQDIYAVGYIGTIVHYNGTTWTKLESGTTSTINDIWGVVNPVTGKRTILCAASNPAQLGERKILSITAQNTVDTIAWTPQREVQSVWFQSATRLFACGDGLFVRRLDGQWRQATGLPLLFKERMRGQSLNDLFVVGDFGLVAHYNGVGWYTYPNATAADVYWSVDQRNDLAVAVGFLGSRAVVLQLRR
jgi:hypothetical protein